MNAPSVRLGHCTIELFPNEHAPICFSVQPCASIVPSESTSVREVASLIALVASLTRRRPASAASAVVAAVHVVVAVTTESSRRHVPLSVLGRFIRPLKEPTLASIGCNGTLEEPPALVSTLLPSHEPDARLVVPIATREALVPRTTRV